MFEAEAERKRALTLCVDSAMCVRFTNALVKSRPLKEIGAEQVILLDTKTYRIV